MTLAPVTRETNTLQIAQQSMQLFGFGEMLINSGLLPSSIRKPESAVALMVKGMELGLPPMAAINGISIIQGKPTVSPQLMLSLINRSGQLEDLDIQTGKDGASVTMKRKGRSAHTATFGPAEAKAMGLDTKDNYKKQAPTMYQWRAVAACARVVFPDVIDGLYTPEEMGADVQVNEDGEMTVQATVQQEPKDDPAVLKQWQEALSKLEARARHNTAAPPEAITAIVRGADWNSVNSLKAAHDALTALGKAHPKPKPEPQDVQDAVFTPAEAEQNAPQTIGKEKAAKIHKVLGAVLKGSDYPDAYAFATEVLEREVKSLAEITPAEEVTLNEAVRDFEQARKEGLE